MNIPVEVTLKRPVTVDGKTWDKLYFDEPDLNAQIGHAELEATLATPPTKADAGRALRFWISHLADVPEKVAGKIKADDIPAIEAALDIVLRIGKSGDASGNGPPAKQQQQTSALPQDS